MFRILAQATNEFTEYSEYTYSTSTQDTSGIFGLGTILLTIGFALVFAFISSFVFKKAGKPMWAAYIPFYNSWVTFQIAGKPGWWIFISLVPLIGIFIYLVLWIIAMLELAKRFGKGELFAVFGLVLFPLIGLIILAFDKSTYRTSSDYAPVDSNNTLPTSPVADNGLYGNATQVQSPQSGPIVSQSPPASGVPQEQERYSQGQVVAPQQPQDQFQPSQHSPQDPEQYKPPTPPQTPTV